MGDGVLLASCGFALLIVVGVAALAVAHLASRTTSGDRVHPPVTLSRCHVQPAVAHAATATTALDVLAPALTFCVIDDAHLVELNPN